MAEFPAEIKVSADVKGALNEIGKVEQKIDKLNKAGKFSFGTKSSPRQRAQARAEQDRLRTEQKVLSTKKAENLEEKKLLNSYNLRQQRARIIAAEAKKTAAAARREAETRKKNIQSTISGSIISAGFPILTGGGGADAVLGGVGGALGGLAGGPLGSFAGGILGTVIGKAISDAEELNKSLSALNATLGNTGKAAQITSKDLKQLANNLGITKEEAITLTDAFNGVAAAGEAAALARQFGNVGGASTAEAIAAAAKDEVSALNAIESLRGQIGLEAAKQLIITLEEKGVQETTVGLLDTILKLNDDIAIAKAKNVRFTDRLLSTWLAIKDVITKVTPLINQNAFRSPEDIAQDRVDAITGSTDRKDRLQELRDYFENLDRLRTKYKPEKETRGRQTALPQSQQLRLLTQLQNIELSLLDVATKRRQLRVTDLAALNVENRALAEKLRIQIQVIEYERQQALASSKVAEDAVFINQVYDKKLQLVKDTNSLLLEQNNIKKDAIKLEKALTAIANEQETADVVRGLTRDTEDANSRNSSAMLSLRIKQLRRQEDLIGNINDQLEKQKQIQKDGDAEAFNKATDEIIALEKRKAAIEALLPELNKAEQQQLRFNQAFAAVTPAVNSLVGGLREVVAGTKTAEEAFADFLTTIADQLISTAATMIAQYIAIGIARMFAFGGNSAAAGAKGIGAAAVSGFSLPGLATGGTANGGQPYIVGENGPELFIPGVTGTVSNNDQFEAARNALLDTSTGEALVENEAALGISSSNISSNGGSSSITNSSSQDGSSSITNSSSQDGSISNYYNQNGSALAAISRSFAENNNTLSTSSSVMRERSMERQNQTTLGGGGSMTIQTQVINEVEYATVDQVAKASALAAKQARAQVFSDMKNKPSRRAAVGLR